MELPGGTVVLPVVAAAAGVDAGAAAGIAVAAVAVAAIPAAAAFAGSAFAIGANHKLAIVKQTARASAADFLALLLRVARFNTAALYIKDSDNQEIIVP
jgi:hypothetical protein